MRDSLSQADVAHRAPAARGSAKFYSQAALTRRGWLASLIHHYIGEPDVVSPAPYGQRGVVHKFEQTRVHAIEALPEFVAARDVCTASGARYCSEASLVAIGWTTVQILHHLGAPDLQFEDRPGAPPRKMYALWRVARVVPEEARATLLSGAPKFACRSTLLQRGWTAQMIDVHLGLPDQVRKNPHRPGTDMFLYALSRVNAVEARLDGSHLRA